MNKHVRPYTTLGIGLGVLLAAAVNAPAAAQSAIPNPQPPSPRCHRALQCEHVACLDHDSSGACVAGDKCRRIVVCN